ncbi:ABC transporter substrate-binding protein [Ferrovibrio sp.]|uniref:ABC transporter substrate-binding protein n=1 Tax=Ferrovibrio sp. TaxID=1917215 RepID=UPI001B5AD021|nr:ABC transporter substrate-binding protein [Ferrovibrio sp.]MBP7065454.1 ABC transporter substrate-binding protein [Ferrovibrio sp.]
MQRHPTRRSFNYLASTALFGLGLAVAGIAPGIGQALAQELKIGLSAEPSALDPHYHNLGPNHQIAAHLFDALLQQDENQKLAPGLAESWKPISETTWEFKLRKGVKFHDGSPFTAADVVFSLNRPPKVPNSPSSLSIYTRPITNIKVVDDHTVQLTTANPYPLLPTDMSRVYIMSSKAAKADVAEGLTTEGLSKGEGLIGTGPYKYSEWVRGNRLVLAANNDYWGGKPKWEKVTFRPMSNDAARVAALLAGDVDMIENPPPADMKKLRENPNVKISQAVSNRLIYIHLDSFTDAPVGIPDAPAGKNPLKDPKVRQALSQAINREAITSRIMEGLGQPTADFLPYPMFGTRKDAKLDPYNPDAAKKLLADAGYPNGFTITLGTPNDRYINDAEVAQAVASQWNRIGVKAKVDAVTRTVFFKNRDEFKYSAYLAGWGAGTGEMSDPLRALVATPNREKGMGTTNKGRYSNPAMDAVLEEALKTVDDKKREELLQKASKIALDDYGLIPLHIEVTPWATRKGLVYKARADQYTLANGVSKE